MHTDGFEKASNERMYRRNTDLRLSYKIKKYERLLSISLHHSSSVTHCSNVLHFRLMPNKKHLKWKLLGEENKLIENLLESMLHAIFILELIISFLFPNFIANILNLLHLRCILNPLCELHQETTCRFCCFQLIIHSKTVST